MIPMNHAEVAALAERTTELGPARLVASVLELDDPIRTTAPCDARID